MTFLLGLWANPVVRKIIIYAAIAAAALYALRWYGNKQFYIGKEEGRVAATVEIEKAKKAEWKAEEDRIAAERIKVATQQSEIMRSRQAITQTLNEIASKANQGKGAISGQVFAVPDASLDAALRAVSTELGPPVIK